MNPGDHFRAPALFDEAALGQVGRRYPDAVAYRHPVDSEQRLQIVATAGHRRGILPAVGIDKPVGGGPGGIQRGGIAHGINVGQHLAGGLVGQLGSDIAQPVKPAPNPDRGGETGGAGLDQPGCTIGGDVVGSRILRSSMLRTNSVQQAWDSWLPTARCSRCLRPSDAMHQATHSASLAP